MAKTAHIEDAWNKDMALVTGIPPRVLEFMKVSYYNGVATAFKIVSDNKAEVVEEMMDEIREFALLGMETKGNPQ